MASRLAGSSRVIESSLISPPPPGRGDPAQKRKNVSHIEQSFLHVWKPNKYGSSALPDPALPG